METRAVPFERMLFVCLNRRATGKPCCAARGGESILEALKAQVQAAGLTGQVRVSRSGCQDLCAEGPNVLLVPEYRWFRRVTLDDVPRIVALLKQPATTEAVRAAT